MKTNLWIVAHGGSGLFPSSMHSSGEICGGELWWAICVAVVEVRREGRDENSDLCGGVRRWWRLGVKQEMRREEWKGSRGSYKCACEREIFFFFFFF